MKKIVELTALALFFVGTIAAQDAPTWSLDEETNIVTEKTTIKISRQADQKNRTMAGMVFLFDPAERSQNGKPALSACVFIVDSRIETSTNRVAEGIYATSLTLKIGDEIREGESANVVLSSGNLAYPTSTNCLLMSIALNEGKQIGAVIPMASGADAQLIMESDNYPAVYEALK